MSDVHYHLEAAMVRMVSDSLVALTSPVLQGTAATAAAEGIFASAAAGQPGTQPQPQHQP